MSMHSLLAWSNIFAPLSRLQCRLDFGGGAFLTNSNQSNSVTMVNQWNSTLTELFTFLCRFHILTPVGEWRFFSLGKTFLASPNIALTLWEDYVLWIISNMTKTHHGRFVSVLGGSQMFSWFSTQFSHEWEPVMRTGSYIYIYGEPDRFSRETYIRFSESFYQLMLLCSSCCSSHSVLLFSHGEVIKL